MESYVLSMLSTPTFTIFIRYERNEQQKIKTKVLLMCSCCRWLFVLKLESIDC